MTNIWRAASEWLSCERSTSVSTRHSGSGLRIARHLQVDHPPAYLTAKTGHATEGWGRETSLGKRSFEHEYKRDRAPYVGESGDDLNDDLGADPARKRRTRFDFVVNRPYRFHVLELVANLVGDHDESCAFSSLDIEEQTFVAGGHRTTVPKINGRRD